MSISNRLNPYLNVSSIHGFNSPLKENGTIDIITESGHAFPYTPGMSFKDPSIQSLLPTEQKKVQYAIALLNYAKSNTLLGEHVTELLSKSKRFSVSLRLNPAGESFQKLFSFNAREDKLYMGLSMDLFMEHNPVLEDIHNSLESQDQTSFMPDFGFELSLALSEATLKEAGVIDGKGLMNAEQVATAYTLASFMSAESLGSDPEQFLNQLKNIPEDASNDEIRERMHTALNFSDQGTHPFFPKFSGENSDLDFFKKIIQLRPHFNKLFE